MFSRFSSALLVCCSAILTPGYTMDLSIGQDVDHRSPAACGNPDLETKRMPAYVETAYPNLRISRPIVICDAGDESNRLFIASQHGTIYVLAADDVEQDDPTVFLDLNEDVSYKDRENEEGLLGMAFHPEFADNGFLYLYYTSAHTPHLSVVSRFSVSKDDTNKIDPNSEVRLMEIPQPAWNHNGGTLAFGPDGYLYIGLGDGGAANDVFGNGQNLSTLLGSILRIDVDKPSDGKKYGIPADNPFIDVEDARPEIYAYGLRNVWRMSFDPKTGDLWAADVGQDLWEEINIIKKGGNYGWSKREAMHPFGPKGVGVSDELVEPIWEYHHEIGKSITGGVVYRGSAIPELQGVYLFADYVTGKMWGIRYDKEKGEVVEHMEVPMPGNVPVITFGTDQSGEVYFTDPAGHILTFVPQK